MLYFGNSYYWKNSLYPSSSLPLVEKDLAVLEKRKVRMVEQSFSYNQLLVQIYRREEPVTKLEKMIEQELNWWGSYLQQRCPWKMLDHALAVSNRIFSLIALYYHRECYENSFYHAISLLEKLCSLEDFLYKKYGFLILADRCFDILHNSYLYLSTSNGNWSDLLLEKINKNTIVYYNYPLAQLLVTQKNIKIESLAGAFQCVSSLQATSRQTQEGNALLTIEYKTVLAEFNIRFSSGEDIADMIKFLESNYCYVDLLEMVLNTLILKEKKAQAEGIILLLLKDFHYQRSREYLFRRLMDIKTKTGFHQSWIVFPTLYQVGSNSSQLKSFAQFLQSQNCWIEDFPYLAQKYAWDENPTSYFQLLLDVSEFRLLFDTVKNDDRLYEYGKVLVGHFPQEVYQRYAILLEKSAKQARVPFDFEMISRRLANLIDMRGGKVARHMIHLFRINYKDNEDFMKSLTRLEEKCF